MKRFICIILAVAVLFSFAACGKNNSGETTAANTESEATPQPEAAKSLVAYFSATGTTKSVAKKIANSTNSDVFEIIPADKYTSQDLNYNEDCRANSEQNDDNVRPEIANSIEDFDSYDVIFIGYPIWWDKLPKIIFTFLEAYDFSGKIVVPFCTSGGSGIEKSVEEINALLPDSTVTSGKRFSSSATDSEISDLISQTRITRIK